MFKFDIDEAGYRNALNQFVTELNANGELLLKEEMRLLLRDVVSFTPPKTQAQGRKAVDADLRRNAAPLDAQKIKIPRMAELVRKRDVEAIQKFADNIKGGFFNRRRLLQTTEDIQAEHRRNRTRYGRVRSDKRNMALLSVWRKYTREVQDRVGFAKAGWLRAAEGVGLKLPNFVTRHAGNAPGQYIAPTPQKLVIESINRSSKIPNYDRTVAAATKRRVNSIKSELNRLLRGGKSRRGSFAGTATGAPSS